MDLVTQFSNPSTEAPIPAVLTNSVPFSAVAVPLATCSLLTSDEISLVAELYRSGATLVQLADRFDIHRNTVVSHLDRCGVNRRPNKRQMTDRQVQEAKALYADNVSLSRIGSRFNVDGSTVSHELRKIGVQIRPRGVRY